MSTEILTPSPGQTVISTHHDHDHERRRRHADLDELIAREQAAGFRDAARDSQTIMRDGKDTRWDLEQSIARSAAAASVAACHTDGVVGAGVASLSGQLCGVSKDVLGGQSHGFAGVQGSLSSGFAAVQSSICAVDYHSLGGFKDAAAQAAEVEGRALLEAAKNAAAISVQATANFNALQVEGTKNFYALSVEAVKNASAAELRAQQIAAASSAQICEFKASAAAQLAACCCELKESIKDQGEATRRQALEVEARVLRDQIAELRRCCPCPGTGRGNGPGNGN